MGTGISAAIPITFKKSNNYQDSYYSSKFFDNYNKLDDEDIYIIRSELLVSNYRPFLDEFYDLIGETQKLEDLNTPDATTFEAFEDVFSHSSRNGKVPFTYDTLGMFSFLAGQSSYYWCFYSGSYKAYLESYSSLMHFERVIQKAMKNPLAQAVKFGMFG